MRQNDKQEIRKRRKDKHRDENEAINIKQKDKEDIKQRRKERKEKMGKKYECGTKRNKKAQGEMDIERIKKKQG